MSTKSNRVLFGIFVAMLLVLAPESGGLSPTGSEISPAQAQGGELKLITFPVAGLSHYGDTFGACRDGCSRSHQGVDIFAAKLTPLIAAVDGTVVSERRNATGKPGNKVVIEDADGWRYSYFHLNNDSPGTDDNANPQAWILANDLRAGDTVQAGDIVGYLGDSGNAETTQPHLHFEINPPGGGAINPTPSVTAARGRDDAISGDAFRADEDDKAEWFDLIDDSYASLAGRPPTESELAEWSNRLALDLGTEADLVGDLAMSAPHREPEGVALRAYVAAFGRLPSDGVLDLLTDSYRSGASPAALAERLVGSADYEQLGGTATATEIAELSVADDVKRETWNTLQVVRAYRAALDRIPDADELEDWTRHLEQEGLMVDVVAGALAGTLPSGPPRHAGAFSANDLGYSPGVDVRQGPIDLNPGTDDLAATFGQRRRSGSEAEVDFELAVEQGDDGTDTANLTVRIPLDQLAAAEAGDAELTIELRLTQPADPDEDAEAEADVDLSITGSRPQPNETPTVEAPTTTRPPTTSPPTTARPTTTRAASTTSSDAPQATTTTAPAPQTTTTACPTPADGSPSATTSSSVAAPPTTPSPTPAPTPTDTPGTETSSGTGSGTTDTQPVTTSPPTTPAPGSATTTTTTTTTATTDCSPTTPPSTTSATPPSTATPTSAGSTSNPAASTSTTPVP